MEIRIRKDLGDIRITAMVDTTVLNPTRDMEDTRITAMVDTTVMNPTRDMEDTRITAMVDTRTTAMEDTTVMEKRLMEVTRVPTTNGPETYMEATKGITRDGKAISALVMNRMLRELRLGALVVIIGALVVITFKY